MHVATKNDGRTQSVSNAADKETSGHKHERRAEKDHGGSKKADVRHAPESPEKTD